MENTAIWHDACEETELDIFENIEQFIRLEGNSGSGYARVEFPPGYSFSRSGYRFVRHEEWEIVLSIMDGARRIGSLVYQCSGGNLRDGDDFAVEAHFYRNGYTGSESMEQYFLNLGFIVPKTRTILTADGYRTSGKTRKSVCMG